MTHAIFQQNSYLQECQSTVTAITELGIILDRTVFYPLSGGQAGDSGYLRLANGDRINIVDTRKEKDVNGVFTGNIVHVTQCAHQKKESDLEIYDFPQPGDVVMACIEWPRRYKIMRFHSATHLLCKLIPFPVDGCSITADGARMDFITTEPLDIDQLNAGLATLIRSNYSIFIHTMSDVEINSDPSLISKMSVPPPQGLSEIRTVQVGDNDFIDLQPCCGTHIAMTSEIGEIGISKIEKKSKTTQRIILRMNK